MPDCHTDPAEDALALCHQALAAILQGDSQAWAGAWASHSTLGIAEALYGAEGIRRMLDSGLAYDEYLLLSRDQRESLWLLEGILLGNTGPAPFTVVQSRTPPYLLLNILGSGLALANTIEHLQFLEKVPHRPEPCPLPAAVARLSAPEKRLLEALGDLPGGWRSVPGALALWRDLQDTGGPVLFGSEAACLAVVCYRTGPWRLTPLVTSAQWARHFAVSPEQFSAAWEALGESSCADDGFFRYLPKVPETGFLASPALESDLMTLVTGFLESLEEEEDEDDEDDEGAEEDGGPDGVIPLFPGNN